MKLLIFDLDGTLVDSALNITKSVNFVRQTINQKAPISVEDVIDFLNDDNTNKAKKLFGSDSDELLNREREVFKEHYLSHCTDNIAFYDGIEDIIIKAKEKNIILAIATNGSSIFAKKILKHLNQIDNFRVIMGADSVKFPKPNPEMLEITMNITNTKPQNTIMIGDSLKDMKASINANCNAIFANWGYGTDSFGMPIAQKPYQLTKIL